MSKRYPTLFEKDGWSQWIAPKTGYRFACCSCNLVHNLEFKAFRPSKRKAKPGYVSVGEELKSVQIMFRAGQNKRATAQRRRKRKA